MHVELASILTAGMNIYLAVTLGHDGTLDEGTMELFDFSGEWLRARRPLLEGTDNVTDVAMLLGTANPKDLHWPGGASGYSEELFKVEANLRANGYLTHRLINSAGSRRYDSIPPTVRTVIVPDRAQLTSSDAEILDGFVRRGGKVLAIGRGMGLTRTEEFRDAAPMFGIHSEGYLSADSFDVKWESKELSVRGPILHVKPTSAEPLLWASILQEGETPLFTGNRIGSGMAYALTTSESALAENGDLLRYLWKETIGQPLWEVEINPERYIVRIRRQKQRHVLHVIDSLTTKEGPMQRYRPLYTRLKINSERTRFQKATVVPDNRPLEISIEGIWKTIEVFPNPELTIALE